MRLYMKLGIILKLHPLLEIPAIILPTSSASVRKQTKVLATVGTKDRGQIGFTTKCMDQ